MCNDIEAQRRCMVMEFMERGTLYDFVRSSQSLEELSSLRLQIAKDIAKGILPTATIICSEPLRFFFNVQECVTYILLNLQSFTVIFQQKTYWYMN